MPEGNRAREKWLRISLNCKKGRVGKNVGQEGYDKKRKPE